MIIEAKKSYRFRGACDYNGKVIRSGLALFTTQYFKGPEKMASPTGIEPVRNSYKKVGFLGVTEVILTIIDGYITIVI